MMPTMTHVRHRSGAFFALLTLMIVSLGCGSFAPRPNATPTPRPTPTPTPRPATLVPVQRPAPRANLLTQTPAASRPNAQAIQPAPPTATPTPVGNLVLGRPARVVTAAGLNLREAPSIKAKRAGRLGAGVLVTVQEGPEQADGYIWWRVDDGYGRAGWVAGGDGQDVWLTGDIGDPRPVNRPVRLGDTVMVTVPFGRSLAVRYEPGKSSLRARRVLRGTRFTVIAGPVSVDGLRWWRVRRADGLVGWVAESDGRDRWLSPIE